MIPEIKKILYAADLSENSSYAFFYAVDMAKRHNARIVILHSIEPIRHFYGEGASLELEEMLRKAKDQERKTDIEEIKQGLQNFCEKVETQMGTPCVEFECDFLW